MSSYEIHRDLSVTQKTAWFILHRIGIRIGMQDDAVSSCLATISPYPAPVAKVVSQRAVKRPWYGSVISLAATRVTGGWEEPRSAATKP